MRPALHHVGRGRLWIALLVTVAASSGAAGADPAGRIATSQALTFPTLAFQEIPSSETQPAVPPAEPNEPEAPPRPYWRKLFTFTLSYSLMSDYVSRGIVYSDYDGEGPEMPNHQMTTELGIDIATLLGREHGTWGTFTFGTWFEWFAGQERLDPEKGARELQEVDYTLSWSYDVQPLHTTATLGYAFYTIPSWIELNTQEWYLTLEHNDAWAWQWLFPGYEDGVLNPAFSLYYDTAFAPNAIWMELGISHDFEFLDDHLTVTPSLDFGIDHRWLGPIQSLNAGSTRLATIQYGLTISYDLTELLHFDKLDAGTIAISGSLYYSDAVGRAESSGEAQNHLYGGTALTWSF